PTSTAHGFPSRSRCRRARSDSVVRTRLPRSAAATGRAPLQKMPARLFFFEPAVEGPAAGRVEGSRLRSLGVLALSHSRWHRGATAIVEAAQLGPPLPVSNAAGDTQATSSPAQEISGRGRS